MVPHEKESPDFIYDQATERQAVRGNKTRRDVPEKAPNRLLDATWNLTIIGVQKRTDDDLARWADKRNRSTGGLFTEYPRHGGSQSPHPRQLKPSLSSVEGQTPHPAAALHNHGQ
jgi:hypothetical protein